MPALKKCRLPSQTSQIFFSRAFGLQARHLLIFGIFLPELLRRLLRYPVGVGSAVYTLNSTPLMVTLVAEKFSTCSSIPMSSTCLK